MGLAADLFDWYPASGDCNGVLVVCHGISEHRARYREWAEWTSDAGWSVLVVDLPGHGTHAAHLGLPDSGKWSSFQERVQSAVATARQKTPNQPVWLVGHSMGSVVVLTAACKRDWSEPLRGIVLVGSMLPRRIEAQSLKMVAGIGRDTGRHRILEALVFGRYQRYFSRDLARTDWISEREDCRDAYAADPLCGFEPSRRLWHMLGEGLCELTHPKCFRNLAEGLEILILAGGEDPVGEFGKGPEKLANRLRHAGVSNTLKRYPVARHELLQNGSDMTVWIDLERMLRDFSQT